MDRIIRQVVGNILVAIIFMMASGQSSAQIVDGIAAVVNDKVITFSEVKRQVDPMEEQLSKIYQGSELIDKIKEARLSMLKSLIERALIIQNFDKQGYYMPDNIIEDNLRDVIAKQYGGDRNALIRTLQANGKPLAGFKQDLKENMIVQFMRGKNVQQAVIVSPFKIEQYYQENVKQFTQPNQIKLRLIFLRKSLFKEKRQDASGKEVEMDPQLAIAEEIHRKVETGSDFANLARSYSEGAQRANGGDWGWVSETTLRSELSKVAFLLRPGQVSGVITTEDGYYILMVEDYRRSTVLPLSEVREQIETTLLQEEKAHLQQEWLDGLRARAYIKMF